MTLETVTRKRLLGVILYGGRSSRMGQDKALLMWSDGRSFLEHAIARADEICDEVCLSGRYVPNDLTDDRLPNEASPTRYRTIDDPSPHLGPVAGVAMTLQVAKAESFSACLVTPIDMPQLTVADLQTMKEIWLANPGTPVCGKSEADGRIEPLVAIYPTSLLSQLQQLAGSEDRSLNRWLQRTDHREFLLSSDSCRNINSPQDLR